MTNDNAPTKRRKRKTLEEKLEDAKNRHKKLEDQIRAQIKNREAREKTKQRKVDTRKKIIIGALAKTHMEKNPHSDFSAKLAQLINEYVVKDTERGYFDLPPLPKQKQKENPLSKVQKNEEPLIIKAVEKTKQQTKQAETKNKSFWKP